MAETAVLSTIAAEVARRGLCRLTVGHIAVMAGVCKATVRTAVRQAVALGILTSEEWRLTAWRSAPNTVRITSPEWRAWLRMRDRKRAGADHPRQAEVFSQLAKEPGAPLACHRNYCGRMVVVAFDDLGLPDETPFPSIKARRRWTCQRCGNREVSVMPNWRDPRGVHAERMISGTQGAYGAPAEGLADGLLHLVQRSRSQSPS